MTSLVRALRRRRHAATRGQRGFALLLTLGLMAFFSVVVVALLGMTLNSAGISTLQASAAKEQRAAESSLDAKINQLRDDPTDRDAGSIDCGNPDQITIDAVDTTIECTWKDGAGPLVPTETGRSLKVIGTGLYNAVIPEPGPGLVNHGNDPLLVTGDALVKTSTEGPLTVGGRYQQGDPCAVGGEVTDLDESPECGTTEASGLGDQEIANTDITWTPSRILPELKPVPDCSTTITLEDGAYDQNATSLLNKRSAECGGATFHFMPGDYWFDVGDDQGNTLTFDRAGSKWIFGGVTPESSFPDDCNDGSRVNITLSPRTSMAHGRGQVAICGSVSQTFDPSLPWRAIPSLVENGQDIDGCQGDPVDNAFVPTGGGLESDEPARAQFTIGSGFGDCRYEDTATLRYTLEDSTDPSPVTSLLVNLDASANYANGKNATTSFSVFRAGTSTPACSVTFPRINDDDAELAYDLTGPPPGPGSCRDVFSSRADLAKAVIEVRFHVHAFIHDSNLMTPSISPDPCGAIRTETVFVQYYAEFCVEVRDFSVTSGWNLAPSSVSEAVNWDPNALVSGGGTATMTVPKGWYFRNFQARFGGFSFPLNDPFVPTSDIGALGLNVTGRSNTSRYFWDGANDQRVALAAGYDETPDLPSSNGGFIKAVLEYGNPIQRCGGLTDGLPLWGESVYVDLLSPQKTVSTGPPEALVPVPTCAAAGVTPAQLKGATVAVVMRSWNASDSFPALLPSDSTETISSVRLVAVPSAGSYTHPDNANRVSSSGSDSFNVFGSWSTPRNDLNVNWIGALSKPERPVVDGQMVVHGLESVQTQAPPGQIGIICCSVGKRAERVVDLTARVNTKPVATSTVRFSDFNGATEDRGHEVFVDRWSVCRIRPSDCPSGAPP